MYNIIYSFFNYYEGFRLNFLINYVMLIILLYKVFFFIGFKFLMLLVCVGIDF